MPLWAIIVIGVLAVDLLIVFMCWRRATLRERRRDYQGRHRLGE